MEFARKQMEKHGWKDGSGLGKKEHGMKEAIKVTLKHDTRGVGHDAGEEFTFHWWDHVFNKAASGIQVDHTEDGVKVKNSGTTERHKTKKTKTYADKSMLYGQFVKASTLTNGDEVEDPEKPEPIMMEEHVKAPVLMPHNEEEILKICGGRTAHKGARHGLKANGKLQRIQQQEEEELKRLMSGSTNQKTGSHSNLTNHTSGKQSDDPAGIKSEPSSKKKKRKLKDVENLGEFDFDEEIKESCEESSGQKKKKKRKKSKGDKVDGVVCEEGEANESVDIKEDIKAGGLEANVNETEVDIVGDEVVSIKKKKKKSKKKRNRDCEEDMVKEESNATKEVKDDILCEEVVQNEDVTDSSKKKKKKKKSKKQLD